MSVAEPTHAPEVALMPESKILGPFAHYDIVPIDTASPSFQTSKAIYQKAKSKAVDHLGGVIPAHVLQTRSTPNPIDTPKTSWARSFSVMSQVQGPVPANSAVFECER
ncbi:hypothetical protein HETIRDRAFT_453742 [Heterobasidion irregulare TC 32-1]|uniref:Uncharacterized protein n=1 Tax=Heterobasidion irregulare (strain TC 32-1) TaxID=747525 RepID=W4K2L7_HETIT|nr:uncharacterized protein HETIRDRAFT_453742 [Heterobasidion irregulare TC 32-1]ETW79296.1 hypothetical protein HETIRDRAFT_453742 [Heterobasidion irregulare TC 32-1]